MDSERTHKMTIVIKPVLATEILINESGDVSIEQIDSYDDRVIVVFPVAHIDAVVAALHALKAE